MRLIKMFGLAAIAAVAAMAFVGASSAMAGSTSLCKEASSELACPTGQQASAVHFFAEDAELLTPDIIVQCDALFSGTTANPLGAPLVFTGHLVYTSCNNLCSVTEESEVATIETLKTGSETATVTGSGEVRVSCGVVINCVYNGNGLVGHGLGPAETGGNGSVIFEEAPVERTGGIGLICPPEAALDAEFVSLTKLWLRS